MTTTTESRVRPARRIQELDALRGLALAGIVMVNTIQITGMPEATGASRDHLDAFLFELAFLQRPYPIFAFLFGIGFAIFLASAANRTDRPRLVLLRRLIVLGALGGLHTLLQPHEVLKFYAAFGIVVLLPASYLDRRWVFGLGVVLTLGAAVTFNGVFLIPGLFLLGMAAAQYGLPQTLDRRGRQIAIAFGIGLVVSIGLGVVQYQAGVGPAHHNRSLPAGLAFAFPIVTGFLLLLRTPLGRPLEAVLAPMGRAALTNYILASALILAGDTIWHFGDRTDYGRVVLFGVAVGVIQAVLSIVWLRFFQYGPLEWLWRCLTWWRVVPLRRQPQVSTVEQ
jgi:uncharacterized protein